MGVAVLLVGAWVVVSWVLPRLGSSRSLAGEFRAHGKPGAVSARVLERDFRNRLPLVVFSRISVSCSGDLAASLGSTAHCDARFPAGWKSGTPQAIRGASGWLADRADYAVTGVEGRTVEYSVAPGLSNAMLENALSRDLGTATYLVCPEDGITGVTGTTVECQANYGYPAGPCSDPLFDEQGRESEVLRRCTLLVGIQKVSGLALDLQILRVTPPA